MITYYRSNHRFYLDSWRNLCIIFIHVCTDVHVQFCPGDSVVKTEDIIGSSLKMTGGVIRFGDVAFIRSSIVDRLQQIRNGIES